MKNKMQKILDDMIKYKKKISSNTNIEPEEYGRSNFLKDCKSIHFGMGRQTGHTTLAAEILRSNNNSVVIHSTDALNSNFISRFPDLKSRSYGKENILHLQGKREIQVPEIIIIDAVQNFRGNWLNSLYSDLVATYDSTDFLLIHLQP